MIRMRLAKLSVLFTVLLGVAGYCLPPASCLQTPCHAAEVADLKEQLEKGLRATQPGQVAFVNKIVQMVKQNRLPRRIVNASFNWARKRRPSYPFPFFERAIRTLAAREGINI
ncbi:MAG TPA: hypothetical protein DCY79_04435 [Planctomycetaceae bacterium]|nr:hypothetical protein [Blastopirellula sp.]HAY79034.1 hypothetical protein [Planctomycetaceae bacterium]